MAQRMSINYGPGIVPLQSANKINDIMSTKHLPFTDSFSDATLCNIIGKYCPNYRERIYTPQTIILGWLSQTLSPDKSCEEAVAKINSERITKALEPASAKTQSYCEAHGHITEGAVHGLACQVSQKIKMSK